MSDFASPPPQLSGLALLVVDVQEAFSRVMPHMDTFAKRCRFAIQAADLLKVPVVFTEQVPDKLGKTLPALTEGKDPRPVFSKTGFSAFAAEGLEEYLKEQEIHHLLIAGLETPVCVYQTVLDALSKDFEVTLLSDAVNARRADDAHWVLTSLRSEGVNVLPSETVFYASLADASHPAFPSFTKLVKSATV